MIAAAAVAHGGRAIVAGIAAMGATAGAGTPAPAVPMRVLRPFTIDHAIAVAWTGALMAIFIGVGRRLRNTARERAWRTAWLAALFAFQAFAVLWFVHPAHLDWKESLPIQVCDLAPWIAGLALTTRHRLWRALLFYWGIGLSTQAFITPINRYPPDHVRYFIFWLGHAQIVGSSIYDLAVLRYRPGWRDFGIGLGATVVYAALVLPLNLAMDWNYGYVGSVRPDAPTIIDRLGPWPLRLVWMFLIMSAVFAGLTLAAGLIPRARRGPSPNEPGGPGSGPPSS